MLPVEIPGRLNWSGPTAPVSRAGLRTLLLPHAAGVLDAVSGKIDQTYYGARPSMHPFVNHRGQTVTGSYNPAATGALIWYGSGSVLAPQTYTRVLVARLFSNTTNYQGVASVATADGASTLWALQSDPSANASIWHSNAAATPAADWSDISFNAYSTLVFRCANSATVSWWINGVRRSDITIGAAPSTPPASARAVLGGARDGTTTYSAPCAIAAFGTFDILLSDQECADLSGDWRHLVEPRRIWVPASAGGGAYTFTGDPGTYTLTGQSAGLLAARMLAADAGTYAMTGQAAGLQRGQQIVADAGSYTHTGQLAGLALSRTLAADAGTYALTGVAAVLAQSRLLTADAGAYALTGRAAGLTYAPAGSYTLTADAGSYSLAGQAVNLQAARRLVADAGAYAHTGQAAGLSKTSGYTLAADAGSYGLTGQAAGFARTLALQLDAGAYVLAGQAVTLRYSGEAAPALEAAPRMMVPMDDLRMMVPMDDLRMMVPMD